jgi:hypothetical protein
MPLQGGGLDSSEPLEGLACLVVSGDGAPRAGATRLARPRQARVVMAWVDWARVVLK